MAQAFINAVLTDSGAALMAESLSEGTLIEFTAIVTGDGTHTDKSRDALKVRTGLLRQRQSFNINSLSRHGENAVKLSTVISNGTLSSGYHLNEIGVYARMDGSQDDPVLYCITTVKGEQGDYFPAYDAEVGEVQIVQSFVVAVANSENVTVRIVSDVYELHSNVGELSDLDTGDSSSIVAAINSVERRQWVGTASEYEAAASGIANGTIVFITDD